MLFASRHLRHGRWRDVKNIPPYGPKHVSVFPLAGIGYLGEVNMDNDYLAAKLNSLEDDRERKLRHLEQHRAKPPVTPN